MTAKTKSTKPSPNSKPKLPKLLVSDIASLATLREKRLKLQRQADAIEAQEKAIKAAAIAHVDANNGRLEKGNFILSLNELTGSVSWKSEFIKQAGHDAAVKLQQAAPRRKQLVITPKK